MKPRWDEGKEVSGRQAGGSESGWKSVCGGV